MNGVLITCVSFVYRECLSLEDDELLSSVDQQTRKQTEQKQV